MSDSVKVYDGERINSTAGAAKTAGVFEEVAGLAGVPTSDAASGELFSLDVTGIHSVIKINGAVTAGDPVFFDDNGDPQGGTAGTGAATTVAADGDLYLGVAVADAGATDERVQVLINRGTKAAAIADHATPATATNEEIATKQNSILAVLRSAGLIDLA